MQLRRFRTVNAHGHLNLDFKLNPDLTFLTGINGSGKTTAVRGIIALLRPSLKELSGIVFDRMDVWGIYKDQEFRVWAIRDGDELTICVEGLEPITVEILKPAPYESAQRYGEQQEEYYRGLRARNAKQATLEFLTGLPTPMFLDLERRAGVIRRRPRDHETFASAPFLGTLGEGLRDAQSLAEDRFREIRIKQQALTDDLRKGLILMSFAQDKEVGTDGQRIPTAEDVGRLGDSYRTVTQALTTLGITDEEIKRQVDPFFQRLQEVVAEVTATPQEQLTRGENLNVLLNYFILEPQERHIQRMVKRTEQYNQHLAFIFAPIHNYLSSVNRFLSDSGKRLAFSAKGQLQVLRGERVLGELSALSSGERQLVVILTHLSFNGLAKAANILIIDEPEISLHIRWQELFVDAVRSADEDIQLILATHSPSIIMSRVANCVDLQDSAS